MKKYEIVTTDFGICFAISIGTVYDIERKIDSSHIKLYNMIYLPGRDQFFYNNDIHLSKELVSYFESLDLCPSSYKEKEEVFQQLESIGAQPIRKYQFLVDQYNRIMGQQKTFVRQYIFNFSSQKKE